MDINAPSHNNKMKFLFYNYNKGILLDEKKKRFVDFEDMDFVSWKNYTSPFIYVKNITKI